jgi:predicted enzyme related to lactoylglutathione lyase
VFARSGHLLPIEFPADDPHRARRFWSEFVEARLEPRAEGKGPGWQTSEQDATSASTAMSGTWRLFLAAYFGVRDLAAALEQVTALGGSVVHPGARWAVCKDSEGSPFGLALEDHVPGMADG